MNIGHARTFITVRGLTDAQSEPSQIWTHGSKHCDELVFHMQVNILVKSAIIPSLDTAFTS